MPNGGLLRVDTFTRKASTGDEAVMRVVDTGTGIPEECLTRIFDPFYTTKDVGKGSGLGLATAFGIVAQHGGRITVSSRVGTGTTFEVILPVTTPRTAPPLASHDETAPRGGTETILLVEDEAAVRMLTRTILERAGYQVIEAANGAAGWRAFQDAGGRVDLVLTDVVMPNGMSGRELADRLMKTRPDLPVLFTSGYSADFAGELALEKRHSFLQKPASPKELLGAVRRSLDR
jgi:CheY-like chemotaxis protein